MVGATQGTPKGGTDAFVTEISASGTVVFSTYLGGTQNENSTGAGNLTGIGAIAVDPAGSNIYIAGNTASSDFPTTAGSAQPAYGGTGDAFVAKYSTGTSSAKFTITNGALSPTSGHAGVSANATITVTSTAGFSSAVALTCAVSPAVTKGPTCSLSPASVTPPANGTVTQQPDINGDWFGQLDGIDNFPSGSGNLYQLEVANAAGTTTVNNLTIALP